MSLLVTIFFGVASLILINIQNGFAMKYCNFDNLHDYRLGDKKKILDGSAIFGYQEGDSMELFTTDHYFNNMYIIIKNIINDLLINYNNNDLDPILDFFEYYQNHSKQMLTKEKFKHFFLTKYHPRTSNQGSLLQTLDSIKKVKSKIRRENGNSIFVATVWPFIDEKSLNLIRDLKFFPNFFKHEKINPVIRIRMNLKLGYIFWDTESGTAEPIVVMDDELEDPNRKYSILNNLSQKYILINHGTFKHLMFVGLPYCSFLSMTAKIRMLRNEISVVQRNDLGEPQNSFSFFLHPTENIFQFSQSCHEFTFKLASEMGPLSCTTNVTVLDELWKLEKYMFYDIFCRQMNANKDVISNKFKELYKLLSDGNFLLFHKDVMHILETERKSRQLQVEKRIKEMRDFKQPSNSHQYSRTESIFQFQNQPKNSLQQNLCAERMRYERTRILKRKKELLKEKSSRAGPEQQRV